MIHTDDVHARQEQCRSILKLPKISVVIPSYNQCQFLTRALDSLAHQCYAGLEVIVVDGGSSDGTVELLKQLTLLTYADIGAVMDMSPQAVKSLLSRARCNLRQALQPYLDRGAPVNGAEAQTVADSQSSSSEPL